MSKNFSVTLSEHFAAFIKRQVQEGRYDSASDVIQAGLRMLEEREASLDKGQAALIEGEQSGPAAPFDFDEFLKKMKRGV